MLDVVRPALHVDETCVNEIMKPCAGRGCRSNASRTPVTRRKHAAMGRDSMLGSVLVLNAPTEHNSPHNS